MSIATFNQRDRRAHGAVRALHVFSTLNRGGAETWLMDVVRRVNRDDLAIDVCLVGDGAGAFEDEFRSLGGMIHRCPLRGHPWRFTRAFSRLLAEQSYDIVHTHLYLFSGFVLRAASGAGVAQRVAHLHPVEDVKVRRRFRTIFARWMRSWIVRFGTHYAAPSKEGSASFWGPDWETDATKSVVYNGIDVGRFSRVIDRGAVRRELDLPDDARIVLNVARFAPHKRHGFLIEVAERIVARDPGVFFLLIGAGDLRDEVMARAAAAGLDQNIRFLAGAPDIDRFWLSADAFAFPSANEGFGIVVAEAAAAGLPVVAQDIPGVREAATACHDVTLLPVDTEAERWSRVLQEAVARGRLSDEARRSHLQIFPFTIERSIEALRELYGMEPVKTGTGS